MQLEIVSVVGGGWSVSQVDLAKIPGAIIAVNDSAFHVPRVDHIVSMDRLWAENRYADLRRKMRPTHIRRAALKNLPDKWPWLTSFDCDHEATAFSDQKGVLNGTNSGLCAFNLAYQLHPKQIMLFGFDMKRGPNGQAHWFADYPWAKPGGATTSGKYREWSQQFVDAKRSCEALGIEVSIVGDSAIWCFPKIDISSFQKVAA